MKIETDADYKLLAKLAYNLCFNAPFNGVEFTQDDINILSNAIDAYDESQGWIIDEPPQDAIDKHKRDMNNTN